MRRRASSIPPRADSASTYIESLPSELRHLSPEHFIPTPSTVLPPLSDTYRKRRSHSKSQPPHHIPRPRNAFILFRCEFVQQRKIPSVYETDHRNISRIAGEVWRTMDNGQRKPWHEMAERERQQHAKMYPGYMYTTGATVSAAATSKKRKTAQKPEHKNHDEQSRTEDRVHVAPTLMPMQAPTPEPQGYTPRRPSSCPEPQDLINPDTLAYANTDFFAQERFMNSFEEQPSSSVLHGMRESSVSHSESISEGERASSTSPVFDWTFSDPSDYACRDANHSATLLSHAITPGIPSGILTSPTDLLDHTFALASEHFSYSPNDIDRLPALVEPDTTPAQLYGPPLLEESLYGPPAITSPLPEFNDLFPSRAGADHTARYAFSGDVMSQGNNATGQQALVSFIDPSFTYQWPAFAESRYNQDRSQGS